MENKRSRPASVRKKRPRGGGSSGGTKRAARSAESSPGDLLPDELKRRILDSNKLPDSTPVIGTRPPGTPKRQLRRSGVYRVGYTVRTDAKILDKFRDVAMAKKDSVQRAFEIAMLMYIGDEWSRDTARSEVMKMLLEDEE